MKQHITTLIIVFAVLAAGIGAVFAGGYNSPVIWSSNASWTDSYSNWWGSSVGQQNWSAMTDPGTIPEYTNGVVKSSQVKRLNFINDVIDDVGDGDLQMAHVWFTRKMTNENKPAFTYYPWLADRILKNYNLQWRDAPPTTTPMMITPYYNNKWILHYTFVRDKDGDSALGLPQYVDDYTVDQIGVSY